MRESLRERLRSGGGPFVVVAHSQGTMIAYCVLMEPEFAELDVPFFVTTGSPLGITEVQDFIKDLTGQKKLPFRQRQPLDQCLRPARPGGARQGHFRPTFARAPAACASRIIAGSIPTRRAIRTPARGTSRMEEVRQPVRECVDTGLFQPVARFKMAKDVVRAFADSAQRRPPPHPGAAPGLRHDRATTAIRRCRGSTRCSVRRRRIPRRAKALRARGAATLRRAQPHAAPRPSCWPPMRTSEKQVSRRAHLEEQREVGDHPPVDPHHAGVPGAQQLPCVGKQRHLGRARLGHQLDASALRRREGDTLKGVYDCTSRKQRRGAGHWISSRSRGTTPRPMTASATARTWPASSPARHMARDADGKERDDVRHGARRRSS